MQDNTIQQLEISIEHARQIVARGEKVRALIANPLFKEIVDDGYLLHEAARLAHLAGDPGLPGSVREDVLRDIHGPGAFKRFIQTILQQAAMAAQELASSQEMLADELLEGEEV